MWAIFFATVVLGAGLAGITDLRPTADWEIRNARGRAHAYAINMNEMHRWAVDYVRRDPGAPNAAPATAPRSLALDWGTQIRPHVLGSYPGVGLGVDCAATACLTPVTLLGTAVPRIRWMEADFEIVLEDAGGVPTGATSAVGRRGYVVTFIQPGIDVPMMSIMEQVRVSLGRGGEYGTIRQIAADTYEFVPFSGSVLRWTGVDLAIGTGALVAMSFVPP